MEQMKKIEKAIEKFFRETNEKGDLQKLTPSKLRICVDLKGEKMKPEVKQKLIDKKWKVTQEGDCYYLS